MQPISIGAIKPARIARLQCDMATIIEHRTGPERRS
jgi:hypothetical protein